jgi:hypothetical protein
MACSSLVANVVGFLDANVYLALGSGGDFSTFAEL